LLAEEGTIDPGRHCSDMDQHLRDSPMEEEEHLTKTEARAGTGPGAMRYVLGISIALVLIAFVVILVFGFR
jgi:hypothetical protein